MNDESRRNQASERTHDLFGRPKALIGMIHVGALPGTPRHDRPLDALVASAAAEAATLEDAGFDALMIENMHDVPYLRRQVGPEIVASMTVLVRAVRETIDLPIGVQVLAGANREALAIAHASGAGWIRAEGFAYAAVADEGLLEEADAGPLLRYRRSIDAGAVAILADVCKKHSAHALTSDVSFEEQVSTTEFMGADGVVVTGAATGAPTDREQLMIAGRASSLPVIVGSGACPETIGDLLDHADAVIVGSATKHDGLWSNPVDPGRADALTAAARKRHP
jgi:hypothetical protein